MKKKKRKPAPNILNTRSMRCPYCGSSVTLKSADGIYKENSRNTQLYVCSRYPACDAYVRVLPGTNIPVGSMANRDLRALRREAHQHFDRLHLSGIMSKHEAYDWLAENIGLVSKVIKDKVTDIGRIGIFTYDDLVQIGRLGLCKAAKTARPSSAAFSTYAYILIRNEIFSALEYATLRKNRETLVDPQLLPETFHEPAHEASIMSDLQNALDEAQQRAGGVTLKGITAIRLLAAGYTNKEIGERMGASANNVTAWVAKARKYLKSDPAILAFREE